MNSSRVAAPLRMLLFFCCISAGCGQANAPLVAAPQKPTPPPIQATATSWPTQPGLTFVDAPTTDEWVNQTFRFQKTYGRVIYVSAEKARPKSIRVPPLNLNYRPGPPGTVNATAAEGDELAVDLLFSTLQEAADAAKGGDLVAVAPGKYRGFSMGDKPDAGDQKFVHFRALGAPGQVTIDEPCAADRGRWMVYLRAAHHVVFQGFNLQGEEAPGDTHADGPWAGIMLDGDFGNTGKLTHHIALVANFSHNHTMWGFHATDTHSVLMEDSVFGYSAKEHGAYVSDGSDNYVIRRNVFLGSRSCGLQCNLDAEASLEETTRNQAFRGDSPLVGSPATSGAAPSEKAAREWAQKTLAKATSLFGENGFPDGRGIHFVIEENVMTNNGRGGGGALNLAGLQHSWIQNNLIYANRNHGIAQWNNASAYDESAVLSPPSNQAEASDLNRLPIFGCHDNTLRNNTVIMGNGGRAAVLIVNGSYRNKLRNNVFINDLDAGMDVDRTSIFGLDSAYSITTTVRYRSAPFHQESVEPFPQGLLAAAKSTFEEPHTKTGISRERFRTEVVAASDEPWVIVDGTWWKLNPARPDFRPKTASGLLRGAGSAADEPPTDLLGVARTSADIGAFVGISASPPK